MNSHLRIGFIDYRPDVGHANTFANYIQNRGKECCKLVFYSSLEKEVGEQWAKQKDLHFTHDVDTMRGQVDGILIPAASNPEHHLELFQSACRLNVPVFIDKPFSENTQVALEIFRQSTQHKIPVFSSSALRFSDEVVELQKNVPTPRFVQTWGGYNDRFDEFIIHPVETAMTLLGPDVQGVTVEKSLDIYEITLHYTDAVKARIYYFPAKQAYEVTACQSERWEHKTIASRFFERLLDQILKTFRTGEPAVAARETLAVMKVLDACKKHIYDTFLPIEWTQEEQQLLSQLP